MTLRRASLREVQKNGSQKLCSARATVLYERVSHLINGANV